MKRRITVRAIIIDEGGKLFCVRLAAYGGKSERDYWCVPGGGIYEAESLHDALDREIIEETAVKPDIGELLYIQQYASAEDDEEQIEFFFHVKNSDDFKSIDISKSTHGEEEIKEYGFINPPNNYILPKFLKTEDIAGQIELNSSAKIFNYL